MHHAQMAYNGATFYARGSSLLDIGWQNSNNCYIHVREKSENLVIWRQQCIDAQSENTYYIEVLKWQLGKGIYSIF